MSNIGKRVKVFDRYLFAVPVMGVITAVSSKDGAYQVTFDSNNPGGKNVTKFNDSYFHHQQCMIDGDHGVEVFSVFLRDSDLRRLRKGEDTSVFCDNDGSPIGARLTVIIPDKTYLVTDSDLRGLLNDLHLCSKGYIYEDRLKEWKMEQKTTDEKEAKA